MHNNRYSNNEQSIRVVGRLLMYVLTLLAAMVLLLVILLWANTGNAAFTPTIFRKEKGEKTEAIKEGFTVNDYSKVPFDSSAEGKLASLGKQLVMETYALIGPESAMKITGNGLSCGNCHLNGGTKYFSAPFIGLAGVFPIYIGRENAIESLEERINGCFERSLNGKAIDVNSREMRAIVTYIKHLSRGIPVGARIPGQGFIDFKIPNRAANPKKGEILYQTTCASCHSANGKGVKSTAGKNKGSYIYPALWGPDSYNDGAGMARLLTAAKFIKGNMPLGTTYDTPMLTDEQAYDIAAFVNSHERPAKTNKELDYPDLSRKPMDCPYPPYNDSISQQQHQYGPFNFTKSKPEKNK